MKVQLDGGQVIDLGTTETTPTIGITDYSRRVTDDFGVTTVVERGFSRRMSVRMALPTDTVDAVQRQLANLRATSALWIADASLQWLNVVGFYKDFSLDLAVPPLSFCTLTVEGLAETEVVADGGGDPAPAGSASTLRLLQPITVDDAQLFAASVPENDAAAWASGTTYADGARVIRAHRVWESLVGGNVGNDPTTTTGSWLDTGPTNRWAMFDQALGTATTGTGSLSATLAPTAPIAAVAFLDAAGATVRVQVMSGSTTVYDQSVAVGGRAVVTFTGLPQTANLKVIATLTGASGSAPVSLGTLLAGAIVSLGITEASPSAGITDYSRKEVDDFGAVTIVQRAWSKRMTAQALIRTDAVDLVANRIAAVRARPSLWIGDSGLDSLSVYGFFKDFSIEVGDVVSKLSLSIEGLSKAAPVMPFGAGSAQLTQGSPDAMNWHLGLLAGDEYMRISNDGGATYGPAIKIVEEAGQAGEDGAYQQLVFRRAVTRPATPTGGGIPAGWYDGVPPDGADPIWWSVQYQRNGVGLGPWSTPGQISGQDGADGSSAFILVPKAGTFINANRITKAATADAAWDASAHSAAGFRGGAVASFRPGQTDKSIFVGLNDNPSNDNGFADIDYAWLCEAGGNRQAWLAGSPVGPVGTYDSASIFQIIYDGRTVRWLKDGGLVWAEDASPDRLLYLDTSLYHPSASIEDVAFSAAGRAGGDGEDGPAGYNNATIPIYQRAAAQPPLPSAQATYTFSTKSLTGLNNGWSTSIPAGTDPVWQSAATASSQAASDTIEANEWAAAVQVARNGQDGTGTPGANGLNNKSVFAYQRAVSQPAPPSQNAVYTFSTASLSGLNNGWSPTIPDGTGIVWVSTATALSPTDNDNINPSEWAAAAKLAQDGAAGADGFAVDTETTNFVQPVYSGGASKPTWTGGSGTIRLNKGGQRITAGVTYAVLGVTDIASLSLSGDTFNFAGATDDAGQFTIRATYNGVNYDKVVSVKKVYDGEAAFKGSVQITGTNVAATTATGVTTAPGGRGLTVSAAVSYIVSTGGAGSYQAALSLYWRNVTDNGPWNLLGTQNGSGATRVNQSSNPQEPEYVDTPGTVSAAYSFTGPASDKQIGFEARVAAAAGVGPVNFYNGSVKLEVSS